MEKSVGRGGGTEGLDTPDADDDEMRGGGADGLKELKRNYFVKKNFKKTVWS